MGPFFNAVIGIAIAFAVYEPGTLASLYGTQRLERVKSELAQAHPGQTLRRDAEQQLQNMRTAFCRDRKDKGGGG